MRRLYSALLLAGLMLAGCNSNDPSQKIQGNWKCTTLRVNGTEILGVDSATTHLVNHYHLNYTGEITSDEGVSYFTYFITEDTLTYYTSTDTIMHAIDTLTNDRLRMHVMMDTVLYEGGYDKL